MSLVNIWLDDDRALVAVDTAHRQLTTGARFEASKLLALPHARLMVAGRGTSLLLKLVHSALAQNSDVCDFDAAARVLPTVLPHLFSAVRDQVKAAVPTALAELDPQEIYLVGWGAQGPQAVVYQQQRAAEGFTATQIDGAWASPWDTELAGPGAFDTPQAMEALARLQIDHVRALFLEEQAIGGRLTLAELTADALTFTWRSLAARTVADLVRPGR